MVMFAADLGALGIQVIKAGSACPTWLFCRQSVGLVEPNLEGQILHRQKQMQLLVLLEKADH